MGIMGKIFGRSGDADDRGQGGPARTPSIDRPTHVVTYTDERGKPVTHQTYSAVAAQQIADDHPGAVISPTRHQ